MFDVLPDSWKQDPDIETILMSAYQVMRVGSNDFSPGVGHSLTLPELEMSALLGYGPINYKDVELQGNWDEQEDVFKYRTMAVDINLEPTGILFVSCILKKEGVSKPEDEVRGNLNSFAGLFALKFGRNIIYNKLFDHVIDLTKKEIEVEGTDMLVLPEAYPKPIFNDVNLKEFFDYSVNLASHKDKNRLMLSLEFFKEAIYLGGSSRAYLHYWQALEILGMPGQNDRYSKIQNKLKAIYSLDGEEDVFYIKSSYKLRSKIVHEGLKFHVPFVLELYIQCLYKDLFLDVLGCLTEKQSYDYLKQNEPAIKKALNFKN